MKCYLTKQDALFALDKMQTFYKDLTSLYSSHDFDLQDNLGRRNILMSQPQEAFFAAALRRNFPKTQNNGATCEPDIFIPELNRELECKLTSKHKSGAISFQSDYETLSKKGKLDYLYIVASEDFDELTVVHYRDLTVDDFRPLSSGSRGKVQLKKHAANDRATVLLGSIEDVTAQNIQKIKALMNTNQTEKAKQKLESRLQFWESSSNRYSIKTEPLHAVS